eukprot:TRINITY_DN8963_c0_g1_i2.p1 TRINITY_DN8963_c0_g1~~TRINITY_DN8963_c0_g1_i2.p1  ORF type:complete len:479 (+),score=105.86 TRINITY_DN8963_c0_g1_i2:77-1438(+)
MAAAAAAPAAGEAPSAPLLPRESWEGLVTRRRKISRRLAFADLAPGSRPATAPAASEGSAPDGGDAVHLEVKLYWPDPEGSDAAHAQLTAQLRVGDRVRCSGPVEVQEDRGGALLLHCKELVLVAAGDGTAPSAATLLPLPPEGSAARARRDADLEQRRERQRRSEREAVREVVGEAAAHGSKASKYHRASLFAQWLTDGPIGDAFRSAAAADPSQGLVLDVAGGRGALAFQLAAEHGVRCATVDSREFCLDKRQHKWLKKRAKQAAREGGGPVDGRSDGSDAAADAEAAAEGPAAEPAVLPQGLASPVGSPLPHLHYLKDFFDADEQGFLGRHKALLPRVRCLVGLHPDQATEPIVDCALRLGLPWAVVPCCVFPKLFPHRRLRGSPDAPVTTYAGLVQYLKEKADGVQIAELPMDGRAIVVYHRGRGATQPDAEPFSGVPPDAKRRRDEPA